MHRCTQCNELVSDERPYCSKCGAAQSVMPHAPVECEACGRELPVPMRFCKWCGAAQTEDTGANDPAATTSLEAGGLARTTAESLEPPPPADTTILETKATTPVMRSPHVPLEHAATTGKLLSAPSNQTRETEESEETLVRPPPPPKVYDAGSALSTPNFTANPTPAKPATPLPRRQNPFALITVSLVALALGIGLAFVLLQNYYRKPSRAGREAAVPVVPVPVPITGWRAATSSGSPAPAIAQPSPVIIAPDPNASVAPVPGSEAASVNGQGVPAASRTSPTPGSAAVRLPPGAPHRGAGEWSGTVLGSAVIEFSGRNQSVAGSAQSLRRAHLSLDNGLPQAPAVVRIDKKKGRGQIVVTQQPSAANNYTARVQITNDKSNSTEDYVFNLTWEAAAK
ncbi:MAG: zinc ribbon domain-containing protein [Pyrinomonadaceae bacterium]